MKRLIGLLALLTLLGSCVQQQEGSAHQMTLESAYAPTLESAGCSRDIYHCSHCGKDFLDEKGEKEVDPSLYRIEPKTQAAEIAKEDIALAITQIDETSPNVRMLDQTDWSKTASGNGAGSFRYYLVDDRPSIRISTEELSEMAIRYRDLNNSGFSSWRFLGGGMETKKVSFSYKGYDLSEELDSAGNHCYVIGGNDVTSEEQGIFLKGDNRWHDVTIDFSEPLVLTCFSMSIYHFTGELYISSLKLSENIDVLADDPYDISPITDEEGGFVASFGLAENRLPLGEYKTALSGNAVLNRDGENQAIGRNITLNKVNENEYRIEGQEFLKGDRLTIQGDFRSNVLGVQCLISIPKTELFFFRSGGSYIHYVNHDVRIVSYADAGAYQNGVLTLEPEGGPYPVGRYAPLSSSFILLDGKYAASSLDDAVEITESGEMHLLLSEQGIEDPIRKNALLNIEGFFENQTDHSGIYFRKQAYQYGGTSWAKVADDTPVTPEEDLSSFHIGIWNGNYHFQDEQRLIDAANMGIDVIVGVNPVWNSNWTSILNKAGELGIRFIVDIRDYDRTKGTYVPWDGRCPSYASHRAILGFFVYDEPNVTQFADIATIREQFDRVMPEDKLFFVNLFSSCCGVAGLYGEERGLAAAFRYEEDYITPFVETVSSDMYGFDSYPLFDTGEIRKAYFCTFADWSYRAKQDNLPLWYSMLSCAHPSGDGGRQYLTPGINEFRFQTNVALSYGVKNFLHYLYAHDEGTYDAVAENDGMIRNQTLYDDCSTIDRELRYLDPVYSQYEYLGTSHLDVGQENLMFQNLKHEIELTGISVSSSSQDLLIGSFSEIEGEKRAYMIANVGSAPYDGNYQSRTRYNANIQYYHGSTQATIQGNYSLAHVHSQGEERIIRFQEGSLSLTIPDMGGAFLVLE